MAAPPRRSEERSRDNGIVVSPRSSEDSRSPAGRTPSARPSNMPSPSPTHRHSFSESLRGNPSSPRQARQFSLSSTGVQELWNNPPRSGAADPTFAGRDWHDIQVSELIDPDDLRFVELDTGIEEATNLLIASSLSVLLIRDKPSDRSATGTFDFKDLNQYLLFATGALHPTPDQLSFFQDLARKAHRNQKIPLQDAKNLGAKEPFVTLAHTANLTKAVELFGGGVHRLIIVQDGTNDVTGVLSQSRLVKFLWENGKSFPIIDQLYPQTIRDLGIGSQRIICINGDRPLVDALKLLDTEGITSLAVLDANSNVIGNISTTDVNLLTKTSSAPLLENTCIHFISVILSTRGLTDGKDSFPVFHISPYSTLAHTVAKLVATRAHRMWVVDSPSPGGSGPPTPSSLPGSGNMSASMATYLPAPSPTYSNQHHASPSMHATVHPPQSSPSPILMSHPIHPPPSMTAPSQATPPFQPTSTAPSISAASLPGQHMSGQLSGVISLTDVLNLFARASGLNPNDPNMTRRLLRRSSSSSSFVRGSLESLRSGVSSDNAR